jgi:phosphocarrier protein
MLERSYIIGKDCTLHARPAAALLKIAKTHGCEVSLKTTKGWEKAGIMNLLLLKTTPGIKITLRADGGSEEECLAAIRLLLEGV